jgi:hypothetical protein
MPDIAVGDICLITLRGSYAGQLIMFTHTYACTEVTGAYDANAVAVDMINAVRAGVGGGDILESKYLDCMSENYSLSRIDGQIVLPTRYVVHSLNRGTVGHIEENPNTGNVAACITLRTPFGGRNQIANKHIGPVPTSSTWLDGGSFKVAYTGKLVALKDGLLVGYDDLVNGFRMRPCITHRTGTPRYIPVTTGVVGSTVRVQRRRTVGYGK